jgi:hypothetical protein
MVEDEGWEGRGKLGPATIVIRSLSLYLRKQQERSLDDTVRTHLSRVVVDKIQNPGVDLWREKIC